MIVLCCVCGEEIEVTMGECISDDDFFCPDCASACFEWCIDEKINPN